MLSSAQILRPASRSPPARTFSWQHQRLDAALDKLGSATHDTGVELSRTTGEVTQHIDGNVDAERDMMLDDLGEADPGLVTRWITGFHQTLQGRNGGGGPFAWQRQIHFS